MARRAFIVGRNSQGLRHCASDAGLMGHALARHAFQVEFPPEDVDVYEVRRHLDRFLTATAQEDILVIYFAGHSLKDGCNGLKLILGQDPNRFENQLDAPALVRNLDEHCRRNRKLLLLDCCEAGDALRCMTWDQRTLAVLSATAERGRARELPWGELQAFLPMGSDDPDSPLPRVDGAGFFTWTLCHALMQAPECHCNPQGEIRDRRLIEYLQEQANLYNQRGGQSVALPRHYPCDHEIPLVVLQTGSGDGFPFELTAGLKELLARHPLAPEDYMAIEDAFVRRAEYPITALRCDPGTPRLIDRLVDHHAHWYYKPENRLPLPLLALAEGIAGRTRRPAELTAWIDRFKAWMRSNALKHEAHLENRQPDAPAASVQAGHGHGLMAVVAPDVADRFEVACYLRDTQGQTRLLSLETVRGSSARAVELARQTIGRWIADEALYAGRSTADRAVPFIELYLPFDRLADEDLETRPPDDPLGIHYPLTLRYQQRLDGQATPQWTRHWQRAVADNFQRPPATPCEPVTLDREHLGWIDDPHERDITFRLEQGATLFGFRCKPSHETLRRMCDAGVAVVLWLREPPSPEVERILCDTLRRWPLEKLPSTVRALRARLKECLELKDLGAIGLLWDDPGRLPGEYDRPLTDPEFQLTFEN